MPIQSLRLLLYCDSQTNRKKLCIGLHHYTRRFKVCTNKKSFPNQTRTRDIYKEDQSVGHLISQKTEFKTTNGKILLKETKLDNFI